MSFHIGQIVCLKSDSSKRGMVSSVFGRQIEVFIDGSKKIYYPSQLITLESDDNEIKFVNYAHFHNFMTIKEILDKSNNRSLLSLNSGKINYIPYQYRPVLKFIKSEQPRILIADTVGVGKTIEAELILKELEARQDVESVLIICPKPLITEKKWENELRKFGEDFIALDGSTLRYCLKELNGALKQWSPRYKKCIIPYSLFDENLLKTLEKLKVHPHFDLIIVDEAHHIRNTETANYKVVKYFMQHTSAAVFLTATPIELQSKDLFTLLNLLRSDIFLNGKTFDEMLEPNKFINDATVAIRNKGANWKKEALDCLLEAESTNWGKGEYGYGDNPKFLDIKKKLSEKELSDEDRVKLITNIEQLNTFSNIINRTRRRDIGNFTTRKSKTVECKFSPEQKQFYDKLLDLERSILQNLHNDVNVAFMMTMLQRQASSCIYGLVPFIDNIMNRNLAKLKEEFSIIDEDELTSYIDEIKEEFECLKEEGLSILQTHDDKFEKLLETIKDKQQEENNKIIIFSTFRCTLHYLLTKLENEGFRVSVIHGDVPDEERRELRRRFMLDKTDPNALDIMLFSEVGCEGLDYQFCNYMVNYDLPWNPQKIEQRIGRIDRNGQQSESVLIVNMITEGTIEKEIYDRCLMRIGIFEDCIGDSEEILGKISEGIEKISRMFELTPEEQAARYQQLADNEIRELQENERLENENCNLLGITINKIELDKEIKDATNCWLLPKEIMLLVSKYLSYIKSGNSFLPEKDKTIYNLRFSRESKNLLFNEYRKLNLRESLRDMEWEEFLNNGEQYINLAFQSDYQSSNEKCILITIQHPLVKQAIEYFKPNMNIDKPIYISIKGEDLNIKEEHYFIIYRWTYHGVTTESKIKIISDDKDIEKELSDNINLLKHFNTEQISYDKNDWARLDFIHEKEWEKEKEEFNNKTKELINYHKQNVLRTFNGIIKNSENTIAQVSDNKIIKLHQGIIENRQLERDNKIKALNDKLGKVDIIFEPLVYGIIK